ncbi:Hypothetical protein ORPV_315 [Orpheovirus IHUMI-LCC2]|uniref:Uncharacterized protein n=1 Tax=Orpheovirus IHUMI-LCC2 TaxID=2023057 RepID=A0A2I2L429_9VIRU|nr:Hypothetical protein ORPV_315 [Orpheovirus IHUMI-LCC2]SNW62219.1 Hypothetical protein ORPV_315 [Orpheovirus IHUMI-LCC2]
MFILRLQNPIHKVISYTKLLKQLNKRIYVKHNKHPHTYKNDVSKLLLYSALVHPLEYKFHNPNIENNDFYKFIDLDTTPSLPMFTHINSNNFLQACLQNQLTFINNIPDDVHINESHIEDYLKFMYLIKKYPNKCFTPSKKIDYIWHAHMLDHNCYMSDTMKYFGYAVNHRDDIPKNKLREHRSETKLLWEKEFGIKYPIDTNKENTNINPITTTALLALAYEISPDALASSYNNNHRKDNNYDRDEKNTSSCSAYTSMSCQIDDDDDGSDGGCGSCGD